MLSIITATTVLLLGITLTEGAPLVADVASTDQAATLTQGHVAPRSFTSAGLTCYCESPGDHREHDSAVC